MMTHAGRVGSLAIVAALSLASTDAQAGNGLKPRIPVDWTGAPCMTIVDRSTGSSLGIDYAISQEDTELTDDEVVDSRTHQFFALCRSHDPQTFLPRWITQADIDRALQAGAAPDGIDPEDIFESSTEWADCWYRINADDARRPITFAAAMAGVSWDTASVPVGTYVVEGYTWEPAINIWSRRPGVIKVVDDPDPAQSGPALAVTNTEEVINKNQSVDIAGCVSAMDGSTITAYWGLADAVIDWQPFIEGDPVIGGDFAVEFAPPEALAGESVMIRVDVDDPMGRSFTNYMYELVIVLGTDGPGDCEDGGGFIGGAGCTPSTGSDGSGTGSDTNGLDATAGTGATSLPPIADDDGGGGGCGGCRSGRPGPLGAGLLLLGLWGMRRRRVARSGLARRP